ncbi:MAG: type II secretion system F family protein [Chloroflexi bacterium]|nr:type II secretion system F family protein [Chloroflexota bacterium]MBP8058392.1 type II secretion system F family protein [Chloroflexota bacterium]
MPTIVLVIGGILALFLLIGASVAFISSSGQRTVDERLEQFVGGVSADEMAEAVEVASNRTDVADRLDKAMVGRGFADRIRIRIAEADVKLRVTEYIILQILCAVGGAVAGYFLFSGNEIFAALGAVLGLRLPKMYMTNAAASRLRKFDSQLSDTLNLWVNSLRSGYSVLQGMEAIATELAPPVSREFERVVQEVRLGLSLSQALSNMLRRVPSEDLDLVNTAINIQREVGGNLAEILDIISFTIRERVRIKGEIRTLTAQQRASGWIISLLPVALAGILFLINPNYMNELFTREAPWIFPNVIPCGWAIVGFTGIMIFIGLQAIRKIVDIEV